jgi:hypothetical protein
MFRRSLILGIGAVLFASSISSADVLIDFESMPGGDKPSDFLAGFGISSVVKGGGGTNFQVRSFSAEPTIVVPSGHQLFLPSGGSFPTPTGLFTTTLTFETPVTFFSFTKAGDTSGTYGMAGWRAQGFDLNGALVDTEERNLSGGLDFPSPPPPVTFTLQGAEPIKSVVFTTNYNFQSTSGTVLLDDFRFAPIPEPTIGTIAGALGLIAMRRRR